MLNGVFKRHNNLEYQSKLNTEADMIIQLSSIKPDIKILKKKNAIVHTNFLGGLENMAFMVTFNKFLIFVF